VAKKKSWLDKGIDSLAADHAYDGKIIVKNMLPQKMSEVLLDFAHPLLDAVSPFDEDMFRAVLRIAIIIWNYSILKDKPDDYSDGGLSQKELHAMIVNPALRLDTLRRRN
jgi:hypothetical protein